MIKVGALYVVYSCFAGSIAKSTPQKTIAMRILIKIYSKTGARQIHKAFCRGILLYTVSVYDFYSLENLWLFFGYFVTFCIFLNKNNLACASTTTQVQIWILLYRTNTLLWNDPELFGNHSGNIPGFQRTTRWITCIGSMQFSMAGVLCFPMEQTTWWCFGCTSKGNQDMLTQSDLPEK